MRRGEGREEKICKKEEREEDGERKKKNRIGEERIEEYGEVKRRKEERR